MRRSHPAAPAPARTEPGDAGVRAAADDAEVGGRRSRYARQSAQLPRIGDSAGEVLSSIADLRKRITHRDDEEDDE